MRLNDSRFIDMIKEVINDGGARVIADAWLAGAFTSNERCITSPGTVEGQTMRAAGPAFDELLAAGFFLPPVAVIVMTAPILMPIILNAGFDPYWFAVILTINLEIGLITPPVGLNLFIINGIAPEISLRDILLGSLPYALCMVAAIVILCFFPGIATWLPNMMMG